MHPVLFTVFGVTFFAYRSLLAVAFLACTLLSVRDFRRADSSSQVSPIIGIWILLGALFGARVFYVLQYESPARLWRAFELWNSGLVFYGGLAGGFAAAAIYFRSVRVPLLSGVDVLAPYLALGEAITRVGCFLNGCCWGSPTDRPWAVRFPLHSFAYDQQLSDGLISPGDPHSLPVHPTQLYMTLGLIAAFLALKSLARYRPPAGSVLFSYFFLYGFLRFVVEMLRADSGRPFLGMTLSQAISAVLLIVGLVLLLATRCGGWDIRRIADRIRPRARSPLE